jgi:anionic cell wall polymer biosynthesis LytR-Cps2A-Psr (LCP) family protein
MKKQQPSIDGFVPRRPGSQIGELHNVKHPERLVQPVDRTLRSEQDLDERRPLVGAPRQDQMIGRSMIDESLQQIDDDRPKKQFRRKKHKDGAVLPTRRKVWRIVKWVLISLAILAVLIGGYLGVKVLLATHSAFKGSIFDLVQTTPLKQDANGRSNFLVVGTSEDDPGHDGSNLTDSILVLSIDQNKKNAYMFSVPRDLYVQYGMACAEGYAGKINDYFSCANTGKDDAAEQDRLSKTQAFIGDIYGLDIQYGVHVNYTVVRDVINAIGGSITVNIEGDNGSGPSPTIGIMDSNFDWKCGASTSQRLKNCPPDGHFIDYEPGPQTLDAEHALYLAQARGDHYPTVGLAQSNPDRERNQQKIMVAIKDKALSTGTLTNLAAVSSLIDALGSNLRTNIQTKEIRTLLDLGKNIPSSDIHSLDFYATGNMLFGSQTFSNSGSSQIPAAGLYDYDDIRAYVAKELSSDPAAAEGANISVLNGSGVSGAGQKVADALTAKGYTVGAIDNAPDGTYPPITIYEITKDKTATADALKKLYNVSITTSAPPFSVTGDTDFVIVVGTSSSH